MDLFPGTNEVVSLAALAVEKNNRCNDSQGAGGFGCPVL